MRVAIFFDGKNFYSAQKLHGIRGRTDFVALSQWLVERVGGKVLTGCHYYTGVEAAGGGPNGVGGEPLLRFLDMLEHQPGFFVYKFPRKVKSYECEHCGKDNVFTQEKEVDTKMVADMLRLAAVGAFDIAILISGDADHAPAVEGLRDLGKLVYVGTWGSTSLAKRIRRAAFDHINLLEGLPIFHQVDTEPTKAPLAEELGRGEAGHLHSAPTLAARADASGSESIVDRAIAATDVRVAVVHTSAPLDSGLAAEQRLSEEHKILLAALQGAEAHFGRNGGFVGANYFLERWTFPGLASTRSQRQKTLNELVILGLVSVTSRPDGQTQVASIR